MIIRNLPFFVHQLRQNLLLRELKASRDNKDDDVEDFALQKLKRQAKEEVKSNLARIVYRAKYNLPPNDPRFLELTDEEIVYDLVLQSEYRKWAEDIQEETTVDDKIIYRNTDEYDELAKRLEAGEDVDLDALIISPDTWEKVDG